MKKVFKNILVIVSTLALVAMPLNVSAKEANSNDFITYNMDESYISELQDMGFESSEIEELNEINNKLANAANFQEVDKLMKEYHSLVDNTPLAAYSSIYAPVGGTLSLSYTGKIHPITNLIFTKVVYLPVAQVSYYQRAINNPGFFDFIAGEGISIVTGIAAGKIAAFLGVTSTSVSWLIGLPISATFFILQNAEVWDLNDAIDRSTTGKVKLEFFYVTNIFPPYYQEIRNFEPWNSTYIDVPADYDFYFATGIFNY